MNSDYLTTPITRKEYWISMIVSWIIISAIVGILNGLFGSSKLAGLVGMAGWVYWIILQTKRLRDANKSFLWLLLDLLTIVGIIVIGCLPSDPAARRTY